MVQNRRVQLVLVYEIDVTPEGDQSAAFARLLQRHQIRMFQAQPIGRGEQEQLIRQRFLKDVQFVDEKRDNMDDVDLFLVFCTGRVADDLYLDLMNRPSGFAGYRLNLTTREAQGGAWQKACLAAGENPPANSAYDLVASLGILSGVGRQLGAFGAIGWVEPSLLDPPPLDPAEAMQDGAPASGQAGGTAAGSRRVRHVPGAAAPPAELQPLQNGDFPCELLFVVRKLNPLPPPPAR
jgi:hypothetical protein